ncbi:hypothetical protein FQZ97_1117200 [compost metagenome]
MARTKGSQNKKQSPPPTTVTLTTEERLTYLANLIVDRIMLDQPTGSLLQKARK